MFDKPGTRFYELWGVAELPLLYQFKLKRIGWTTSTRVCYFSYMISSTIHFIVYNCTAIQLYNCTTTCLLCTRCVWSLGIVLSIQWSMTPTGSFSPSHRSSTEIIRRSHSTQSNIIIFYSNIFIQKYFFKALSF